MVFKKKKKVKISDIIIPDRYFNNPPSFRKIIQKTADYTCSGFIDKIYVTSDLVLWDGYCSYLILKALEYDKVKVIVTGGEKWKK